MSANEFFSLLPLHYAGNLSNLGSILPHLQDCQQSCNLDQLPHLPHSLGLVYHLDHDWSKLAGNLAPCH